MNAVLLTLAVLLSAAEPAVEAVETPSTRVYVRTIPPGARVRLDGEKVLGPSDGLFLVPPGVRNLKIEMDGYEPEIRRIEARDGRITRVEVVLKKASDGEKSGQRETPPPDDLEPDPFGAPPPDPKLQAQGRKILAEVIRVNRHWLIGPAKSVKSFAFSYRLKDEPAKTYTVGDAAAARAGLLQGTTYYSPLHEMAMHPEDVTFEKIDVGDETITLEYALAEPISAAYGNGIEGHWYGYFEREVGKGTLVLDAKRFTPIAHRMKGLEERFSDYVRIIAKVPPGAYVVTNPFFPELAPSKIDIGGDALSFEWRFKVYEPGLWILGEAFYKDDDGSMRPIVTLEVTKINGEPPVVDADRE